MKCVLFQVIIILGFTAKLCADCNTESGQAFQNLRISHGWLRAMLQGDNSSGYLKIKNFGTKDARLTSIQTDFAEITDVHLVREEYGVSRMIRMMDGIVIPAGSDVEFLPGALHIMFINLKKSLKVNDIKTAILSFENLGSISINFCVKKITAKSYYVSDN